MHDLQTNDSTRDRMHSNYSTIHYEKDTVLCALYFVPCTLGWGHSMYFVFCTLLRSVLYFLIAQVTYYLLIPTVHTKAPTVHITQPNQNA